MYFPSRIGKAAMFAVMAVLVPISFSASTESPVGITVKSSILCATAGLCQELCDPGPYRCAWVRTDSGNWALCLGPEPVAPPNPPKT